MREFINIVESAAVEWPLQGVDLTSVETFLGSLKKIPRAQVTALQQLMNRAHEETTRPGPGYVELYHGAPRHVADAIKDGGFALTKGRRQGFLGAINQVDNLGVFLTDAKPIAHYFGSNRSDTGNNYDVLTCWVDVSRVLDWTKAPLAIRKLGLQILQKWDGVQRAKIPMKEWWWLLDKPDFVEAIKDAGYSGVMYKEDIAVRRRSGDGHTYFIFDPSTIKVQGRDGVSTVRQFYAWLVAHAQAGAQAEA